MRPTSLLILSSMAFVACTETVLTRNAPTDPVEDTSPSAPATDPPSSHGTPPGSTRGDGGTTDAGALAPPPSCAPGGGPGTANDCGQGASCCATATVPGGTFYRWKTTPSPLSGKDHPATLRAFSLDAFETTVGRFRRFVEAGNGTRVRPPAQGSGAHPSIPGSGWRSEWNALLPADRIALDTALVREKPVTIWTQAPGPNETKPMKGIGYALAFAFCAWDGGRLPTAAEWNFAAAGGDEYRMYPWGDTLDRTRAVYDCREDGADIGCDPSDLPAVGSKPAGAGRWGHFDLVGSVREWALDSDPDLLPCTDCGVVDPTGAWTIVMGGSFWGREISAVTSASIVLKQEPAPDFEAGVRCARDLPRGAP